MPPFECPPGTCDICHPPTDGLADWERDVLTGRPWNEGEGDVVFTLHDGTTLAINGVRVDSVGPSADARGVIAMEFFGSDRIIHVPFVRSWEFTYD